MTPEEIHEIQLLQEAERLGELDLAGTARLHRLRTKLALSPEVADDPTTWLVDEAQRPELAGGDRYAAERQRCCDELGAILERVGRVTFEAAVQLVLSRR